MHLLLLFGRLNPPEVSVTVNNPRAPLPAILPAFLSGSGLGMSPITDIPAFQDYPDNGPEIFPPPPGPTPTGGYEYITVPRPPPVLPNTPFFNAFTSYQQIDYEIALRNVYAERIDLVTGTRVYRVLLQYLWHFDKDINGPFIGRPPLTQYRFGITDPTIGIAAINDWTPIL